MSPAEKMGRVLIVAGSDSGGGAGLQADIKTVTMLGQYASTAVTAITVQNTLGVTDVMPVPAETVAAQMRAVMDDIGTDVIKTGMLYDRAIIDTVLQVIDDAAFDGDLVVDPVMIATSGAKLIDDDAIEALKTLVAHASLVTPNAPEAEALTGMTIDTFDDMKAAAYKILDSGAEAVLITGGHLAGKQVTDLLVSLKGECQITSDRIETRHTHGTGCTLASAMAALLAEGLSLEDAFERAHAYVHTAIAKAPGFGKGYGPLGHALVRPETN
ncbi:bifunctional hydroxymethylpyrimidine kinase/phosphomethylpyrimidine kinase [Kordiimonas marina]|uniref:bifunctional hydroxymethylpyrimidine kinase/phosphomethylpyrimidine kinase n=1 Tax=Kordiimonas marina TaxID=2872312 RepID=UPI001FF289D3|nr:bifunctional hydroxymethylpyrimidine kinase/phosphomethylpyrimidine kinase [Kordiimonas marina]MCJ9427604.1 bifunctional hydroxymethylpyrimidine kinase/phosphomethylpyrimidine kinase [Kordiimonas marina]